jgi:hypothetical protein
MRLGKDTYEIFPAAEVNARFPADGGIYLGDEGGRYADKGHPAFPSSGAEPPYIQERAPPYQADSLAPVQRVLVELFPYPASFGQGFKGFAAFQGQKRGLLAQRI